MFILKFLGKDQPPPKIPPPIPATLNPGFDPPSPNDPAIKFPKVGIPGTPGIGDGIPKLSFATGAFFLVAGGVVIG